MKSNCILHLEDDDNDSFFFQRALDQLSFTGIYRRVASVAETIEYLTGGRAFADRELHPLPDILVTDSSFGTGAAPIDLIKWLDTRPGFKHLVCVILTGGMSESDQQKWLHCGVKRILLKGSNLDDFAVSVGKILECGG